jgi:hypothetical protein
MRPVGPERMSLAKLSNWLHQDYLEREDYPGIYKVTACVTARPVECFGTWPLVTCYDLESQSLAEGFHA